MASLFNMPTPEAVRAQARQSVFKQPIAPRGRGFVQVAQQAGGLFGEALGRSQGGLAPGEAEAMKFQQAQQEITKQSEGLKLSDPNDYIKMTGIAAEVFNSVGLSEQANQAALKGLEVRRQFSGDTRDAVERDTLNQRKLEQNFKERQAKIKSEELSPTVQKILDKAQTEAISAGQNASSFDVLASDVEKSDFEGGIVASVKETMKNLTGQQDAVSDLRLKYNAVRASQAVTNLPPGPASDKDIALALSGFPKDNAPATQLARFLRGTAKLQRINEAFLTFKSDKISKKKGTRALLQDWKKKSFSDTLGREVQTSEIYITAANRGLSIQEVKDKLGIKQ